MSKLLKVLGVFLVVLAAAYGLLMKYLLPSYLTSALPLAEKTATTYINGKVNIGDIGISPRFGLTIGDISVSNSKGDEVLNVPSLEVGLSPLGAIQGKSAASAVSSVRINNPVLHVTMNKEDKWNVSGLIKPTEESSNAFKGKVYVNNGHILVKTPYGNWEAGVQGVVDAADDPEYTIDSDFFLDNETVSLRGHLNSDLEGRLNFKTESLKMDSFAKILAHYIPVEDIKGSLKKVDISWENKGRVSMSGGGTFAGTSGEVTAGGYDIPLTLNGDVKFNGMAILAHNLRALVNDQPLVITGGLDLNDTDNPKAENLTINFDKFNLQKAESSLPAAGEITGKVNINGTKEDYLVDGKLTAPILTAYGYTFRNVVVPVVTDMGKLITTHATADFGGGKLAANGEYNIKSKDVAVGIDALKVDLTPVVGQKVGNLVVDGSMLLAGNFSGKTLKLSSVGDFMTLKWRGTEFNNLAVDIDVDGSNITVNNLSAFTEHQGVILGQGKVSGNNIDANVQMAHLDLADFLPLVGKTGTGALSGNFSIKGTTDNFDAKGPFSLDNAVIEGVAVQEAHGYVGWENNILTLKKVEVNMEQGEHLLDGTVNMQGPDPVLDLVVATDNVRIEPLVKLANLAMPITGNLTNKAIIKGPLSKVTVAGDVHAWDGSVNKFLVDDVAGTYTYEKGELTLKNFILHTLTTDIKLEGTMDAGGKLNFGMDAKNVHLARIPGLNNYADVEGMVDFSGSISGNYKAPLFNGALTSNNISVNGEGFTGVACFLHSKGGAVNELNGTFQQTAGGDYAVDLLVDFDQKLVQGNVEITGGNVKSLLNIAKEDLEIEGLLTGKIELNKNGAHTGMTVVGNIDKAAVRGIGFKTAEFDVFANRGYWKINNLKAEETGGGLFVAQGVIDARPGRRTIDLEVGANQASAKLITAAMTNPIDLEGKMDVAAQVKGSLDNPEGNFSLQVSPGSISGVAFDNLYGLANLRDDNFKVEQILIQKGEYKISAYGTFPQDLLRREEDRKHRNSKMDIQLKFDNANLAILPSLSKMVEAATGDIDGGLTITGTLEDHNVDGKVTVNHGNIKFKHVKTTLDNIKLDMDFAGKQVNLKELSATTGKKGKIESHGTFALTNATEAPYLLDFSAKDVRIESSVFKGTINANAEVEQKRNRPHVTSHIKLDDVVVDITSVPEFGEGGSNMGLNITLELGPKIHLHNTYFYNIWLAGGLEVKGSTRHPRIDGTIYATKGTVSYINTPFTIDHAELTWPERTFTPHVNFEANTRFRSYNIAVKANGPLTMDTLSAHLISDPPKSQKEIVRMLTLKTEGGTGDEDMQSLLDAGLQMAFLSDVEDFVKRATGLDDFRVYSGNTRSSLGFDLDSVRASSATSEDKKQYNLLISKNIGKNIMVGYTTSFDQEYHSVFAEYRLSRHLNLNFSQNEKREKWYGIQYQTSF